MDQIHIPVQTYAVGTCYDVDVRHDEGNGSDLGFAVRAFLDGAHEYILVHWLVVVTHDF